MLLSLDLGSRYCGLVVLADVFPPVVLGSTTIDVDIANLDPVAEQIIGAIGVALTAPERPRVVIEWGRFSVPAKDTPAKTAAAGAAMGEARDPMICIRDRVEQYCKTVDVEVIRINAKTWRSRIGCKARDDAEVSRALVSHVPIVGLKTEHERDAAGAAIGLLIGERDAVTPKSPGAKRVRATPKTLARRAQDAALDAALEEAQARVAGAAALVDLRRDRRQDHHCSRCGEAGHNAPTCPVPLPQKISHHPLT